MQNLGDTQIYPTLPVKLKTVFSSVLFNFELYVDSFGSRRGADDGEVGSAIAVVLNPLANLLFLYSKSFLPSKFAFSTIVVVYWTG